MEGYHLSGRNDVFISSKQEFEDCILKKQFQLNRRESECYEGVQRLLENQKVSFDEMSISEQIQIIKMEFSKTSCSESMECNEPSASDVCSTVPTFEAISSKHAKSKELEDCILKKEFQLNRRESECYERVQRLLENQKVSFHEMSISEQIQIIKMEFSKTSCSESMECVEPSESVCSTLPTFEALACEVEEFEIRKPFTKQKNPETICSTEGSHSSFQISDERVRFLKQDTGESLSPHKLNTNLYQDPEYIAFEISEHKTVFSSENLYGRHNEVVEDLCVLQNYFTSKLLLITQDWDDLQRYPVSRRLFSKGYFISTLIEARSVGKRHEIIYLGLLCIFLSVHNQLTSLVFYNFWSRWRQKETCK